VLFVHNPEALSTLLGANDGRFRVNHNLRSSVANRVAEAVLKEVMFLLTQVAKKCTHANAVALPLHRALR
jgi:hypothetical protein